MASSRTVGVHEAKTQFSKLLHDVEAGEEVVVTRAGDAIEQAGDDAVISAASVWELSAECATGKYDGDDLLAPAQAAGSQILPITGEHGKLAGELPLHHRDPFAHVLIAQALLEHRVLVSSDQVLPRYGVPVLW